MSEATLLQSDPFPLTIDPASYVASPARERALAQLLSALDAGFVPCLEGPTGIGKTMLLRVLGERVAARYTPLYLPYPLLSAREHCTMVLGLLTRGGASDPEAVLEAVAAELALNGRPLLLLLDDAASLPAESARGLAALVARSHRRLRLVLAGIGGESLLRAIEPFGDGLVRVALEEGVPDAALAGYVAAQLERAHAPESLWQAFDDDTLAELGRQAAGNPRQLHIAAQTILRRVEEAASPFAHVAHRSTPIIVPRSTPSVGPREETPLSMAPPVAEPEAVETEVAEPITPSPTQVSPAIPARDEADAPIARGAAPELAPVTPPPAPIETEPPMPVPPPVAIEVEPSAPVMQSVTVEAEPPMPEWPHLAIETEPPTPAPPPVAIEVEASEPVMQSVTVEAEPPTPEWPHLAIEVEPSAPVMQPLTVEAEPPTPVTPPVAIETPAPPPSRVAAIDVPEPRAPLELPDAPPVATSVEVLIAALAAAPVEAAARPSMAAPVEPTVVTPAVPTSDRMSVSPAAPAAREPVDLVGEYRYVRGLAPSPSAPRRAESKRKVELPAAQIDLTLAPLLELQRSEAISERVRARERARSRAERAPRRGFSFVGVGLVALISALVGFVLASQIDRGRDGLQTFVNWLEAVRSRTSVPDPERAVKAKASPAQVPAPAPVDAVAPEPIAAAPSEPQPAVESGGPVTPESEVAATVEEPIVPSAPPEAEAPAPVEEPAEPIAPPPPPPIEVSINATPWARIEIDGEPAGETPLGAVSLQPGEHRFRAVFPDGRVRERKIDVDAEHRIIVFE